MKDIISKGTKQFLFWKKQYEANHIAAYSAQAAYFILLSFVPMIMVFIMVVARFAPLNIQGIYQLADSFIADIYGSDALELMGSIRDRSAVPVLSVSFVFVVWAAVSGVRSIADGLAAIYDVPKRYNMVQLGIRAVVYTFAMTAVCLLSFVIVAAAPKLEEFSAELLGISISPILTTGTVVLFFTLTLLFASAYKTLAKNRISFAKHFAGGAVAAAGWILFSLGYSVYIKYFSRYPVVYGAFGAVMLFMLWLYMCMNILLCGAMLNKIIWDKNCD